MKNLVIPVQNATAHSEWLDFVRTLNRRSKISLTATFTPDLDDTDQPPAATVARQSRRLSEFCDAQSIPCRIRTNDAGHSVSSIRRDIRRADLQLLDSRHFIDNIGDSRPSIYGQKTLRNTSCPVLLLPAEPTLPGSIILTYDGTPGSIRAIRKFAHLFPEFSSIATTLVHVDEKGKGAIPKHDLMREIGNKLFRNFRMVNLRLTTNEFYDAWISMMTNPWLVAGAFSPSEWSRLFSPGFINRLVKNHPVPLFLAHN